MQNKKTFDKYIYIFVVFLVLALFIIYLNNTLSNNSIWLDESFSIGVIKRSFSDIINITAIDVHPPLYYFLYKLFYASLTMLNIPLSVVIIGKLFSLLCFLLLLLIGFIFVKKEFGYYSASIFNLLLIVLPNIFYSALDIRMYMLAMLLVTLTFIAGYYVIKNNSLLGYFGLFVFALLSSYTHYYACLACIFIYLLVLAYLIKQKRKLLQFIITSLLMIVCYSPWLMVLIEQFKTVSTDYWIPVINNETINSWFSYFLHPYRDLNMSLIFVVSLLLISVIALWKKSKQTLNIEQHYIFYGILLPFLVILLGYLVSIIYRPLYFNRYVLPALGVFILGYAVLMEHFTTNKWIKLIPIILLSVSALYTNTDIIKMEDNRSNKTLELQEELNGFNQNDEIIFEDSQIQRTVSVMTSAKTYLFDPGTSHLTHLVYDNVFDYEGIQMIDEALNEGHDVYFVPSYDSIQKAEFEYNGYSMVIVGSYQLESYFFDIYGITKN